MTESENNVVFLNYQIKARVERFHFLSTLKDLRLREGNYSLERLFCSNIEAQGRKEQEVKRHGHCKCTSKRRRQINVFQNECKYMQIPSISLYSFFFS